MSDEATLLRRRITDLEHILDQVDLVNRLAEQYRRRQADEHYQQADNNKRKDRH